MSPTPKRAGQSVVGSASVLRDPIIPLTFGDWLPKVFRVFSRSFARLGTLALIPVGVAGLYTVSMSFVVTDEAGMRQEVAAAATADPTGQASAATAFWAV
ncbi:MAG TPA: hypothetical protein VGH89_00290, partial [Pseudonocardia sp.]